MRCELNFGSVDLAKRKIIDTQRGVSPSNTGVFRLTVMEMSITFIIFAYSRKSVCAKQFESVDSVRKIVT